MNEWLSFSFALMFLWPSYFCHWPLDPFSKSLHEEEKIKTCWCQLKIQLLNIMCCDHVTIITKTNAHFHPGDSQGFFLPWPPKSFRIHIISPSLDVFSFENEIWASVVDMLVQYFLCPQFSLLFLHGPNCPSCRAELVICTWGDV